MNSFLRNVLIGSALLTGSVDTAAAQAKPVVEVIDPRTAFDGKLSKVLAEMERKRELTLPETVAVMTYSSRREFCQAVVAWSQSFIDEIQYPDEEEFDQKGELIPVGIGQGEFFEQVLAPTISKGCLSPKERRAYFDYYKTQALQIYVRRVGLIHKIIAPYKKDLEKDELKAARFKKGSEYIRALQIKLEKERSIHYEDLFKDGASGFEVPVADGRYYTDAVKLLEKLKKSPNDLNTLVEVTTSLNAYDKLYHSSNVSDEDKEDLLKGIMLLMDYQITLIHNALPTEGDSVSSTIDTEGTAVGETQFEAVMTNDVKRRFEVPDVKLEDEIKKTQVYVANNDSYWLRLAELDFYTYATRDFLTTLGKRPNLEVISQWERSMEVASKAFAELPVGRKASAGIYTTLAGYHDDQWILDRDYDATLLRAPNKTPSGANVGIYIDKYGPNLYLLDPTYRYTMALMNSNACNESVAGMDKTESTGWIVSCGFGVGDNLDHVFETLAALPPERKARVDQIGGETADVPLGFLVKIAKEHMAE